MQESGKPRTYKIWEPMLLACCTLLGLYAGSQLFESHPQKPASVESSRPDRGRELNEIVRFIEEKYVDDVDENALISSAISALLRELDPHSGYLSPDEVRELNEKMEGHFEGIGIEFHRILDTAIVLHVNPGGPADKAGLKIFDRIIAANDSNLLSPDLTEREMISQLRGSKESMVKLDIARPGVDTLITIRIQRDEIPIRSVEGAYMIQPEVGYLRINRFSAKTYREFMEEVERLVQQEKMKDLIIDVRQNPGGYLKEAVNILSQLFKEKDLLLVYTEGENAAKVEYHTTGKPFYPVSNIVVLVDDGSASASEIVAGALQDYDRGIIIGTPTFGKGLVQEQYALSNGGALRLTVARYYTPSGRLIQKPYSNGDSVDTEQVPETDTTAYYTAGGREVNGAGGITPDILVEQEFNWEDKRFGQLYESVLEYAIHGFDHSGKYTSPEELIASFPDEDELAQDVIDYYGSFQNADRTIETEFINHHKKYVRLMLMGMLSTAQFGHDSWYRIMNESDPVVRKALEVIKADRKITLKY